MPQLLLELFSEEIPARMQANAARDLERMARERLEADGLGDARIHTYAGPRRLTLVADNLPAAQADRSEELKGPKVGAPPQAMEGFLRKVGLTQSDLTERDGVWFATVSSKGKPTADVIAAMVEEIVRNFPWPKSMKWGTCSLRWVRPLQRILCVFDGAVVPIDIEGIKSGNLTEGHRFMGTEQGPFAVTDFTSYALGLDRRFVVLEADERRKRILEGAKAVCAAKGLELVEDEGLLEEVAGLAEWPVPILGDMDPSFLDLPPEVIRTSMRTHQKYFAVRVPLDLRLAPHFVVVANISATDGGKAIAAGNARVLSARLNDARFFWDEDRKPGKFELWQEKLAGVTFHAQLGSMAQRVERIKALSKSVAVAFGEDPVDAEFAAGLAKADLVSAMVGEFPELQGIMGAYYAEQFGRQITSAIRDHYKPQGRSDELPSTRLACAVAVADKFDSLVSFFHIGEKPTGSKDPFALRRAALGIVRILIETGTRLSVLTLLTDEVVARSVPGANALALKDGVPVTSLEVLEFLADRLKVQLRDQGKRHDLVDAVFALGDDDLVRIVARVEALDKFLATDDGANLLAGYKRAANILRSEEKKAPLPVFAKPMRMPGAPAAEITLIAVLHDVAPKVEAALETEDFAAAMTALAALRQPVDTFFDDVMVNSTVATERDNRLRLLMQVRDLMGRVADFSQVSG